jgi:hypothetical protein
MSVFGPPCSHGPCGRAERSMAKAGGPCAVTRGSTESGLCVLPCESWSGSNAHRARATDPWLQRPADQPDRCENGAGDEIRTHDVLLGKEVLYH